MTNSELMQSSSELNSCLPLAAAILDGKGVNMDEFLAAVVREQQAIGFRVRGLLMRRPSRQSGCAPTMYLVDISTGDEYLVSQPMGASSKSCRADPQGFARASSVLRDGLTQSPDLAISNRFGDLEVQRGGFTAELLDVMASGVPLLTSVAERNAGAWQEFTGGGVLLKPDHGEVRQWLAQARRLAASAVTPEAD
jgi:hypothetical protein